MLLFNRTSIKFSNYNRTISIHLMLLFNMQGLDYADIAEEHFNTSNVTIQLFFKAFFSLCNSISIHLMLLFNENGLKLWNGMMVHFNTSNVTIQPMAVLHQATIQLNFNTSNVTIQRSQSLSYRDTGAISIHLMLLFNSTKIAVPPTEYLFQYI